MIEGLPPSPLPTDIAEDVTNMPATLTEDERWDIERLVELAYHRGYGDGHFRGWQSGIRSERRERTLVMDPSPPPPPDPPAPLRPAARDPEPPDDDDASPPAQRRTDAHAEDPEGPVTTTTLVVIGIGIGGLGCAIGCYITILRNEHDRAMNARREDRRRDT